MSRFACLSLSCLFLLLLSSAAGAEDQPGMPSTPQMMDQPKGDEKGPVIKPEEAKDNVGKEVVVEFVVVGGRMLEDKGIAFLNSSNDQNDPAGFTVFINKSALSKFKDESKIDDPADHFSQKKIRVSGKIKKYKDKAEIEVASPSQIKLVEDENKPASEENKPAEENKM